jgi:hypothetical protein
MEITREKLEEFVGLAINLGLDQPHLMKKESDKKRIIKWFVDNAIEELKNNEH